MKKAAPNPNQHSFLFPNLIAQLNPKHPLLKLANAIAWDYFEAEFSPLYSPLGKPAKPIRLMVGLSILKHMEDLSDEELVYRWVQNPYYQVFCGETEFQWALPCDPSEMTYFRRRIGEAGFEKILAASMALFGEQAQEEEVCVDTTVQEKNITFPTDAKQYRKIISHCIKIARLEAIKLPRTYAKEVRQLKQQTRFAAHPKNRKKARRAAKRLKTIAGRLLRALQRQLGEDIGTDYAERFTLYERMLKQKRGDKNKLYSLHEPHIYCMSKGKEHKRYEFGTKVSIVKTRDSNVIVGAIAFESNRFDGHTIPDALTQVTKLAGYMPNIAIADRGYRGQSKFKNTRIVIPRPPKKNASREAMETQRLRF